MTLRRLALAAICHYRRPHAAVALGVAGAVTVLAGSLLVGASVRDSLRSITTGRLGHTSIASAREQPFTEHLADRVAAGAAAASDSAAVLDRHGTARVVIEAGRRVQVYGVDARFFSFTASSRRARRRSTCCSVPISPRSLAPRRRRRGRARRASRPTFRSIRCTAGATMRAGRFD